MSTTETQLEAVRAAVEPAVAALGCDLYDVEFAGSGPARTLRVTVTNSAENSSGGLDLDAITAITQRVSPLVDDVPINGSFLLEVSSPGIERTLRRPEHYAGAIGELVSVKFHTEQGPRRVRGTLQAIDGDTIVVASEDDDTDVEIVLSAVTQARTIFEWGPQPRAKGGNKTRTRAKGKV